MTAITIRLLRHMAWANQKVYEAVKDLPGLALDASIANLEWTVGRILQHIVEGADWYSYCLTEVALRDIELPNSMSDLTSLEVQLAEFDARISSQADLPDELLTIKEEGGSWEALRSTILVQAIYHAVEHRTQLMDALECNGFTPIRLDDLDLWQFERFEEKQES